MTDAEELFCCVCHEDCSDEPCYDYEDDGYGSCIEAIYCKRCYAGVQR